MAEICGIVRYRSDYVDGLYQGEFLAQTKDTGVVGCAESHQQPLVYSGVDTQVVKQFLQVTRTQLRRSARRLDHPGQFIDFGSLFHILTIA
jgi:hypothetical protein